MPSLNPRIGLPDQSMKHSISYEIEALIVTSSKSMDLPEAKVSYYPKHRTKQNRHFSLCSREKDLMLQAKIMSSFRSVSMGLKFPHLQLATEQILSSFRLLKITNDCLMVTPDQILAVWAPIRHYLPNSSVKTKQLKFMLSPHKALLAWPARTHPIKGFFISVLCS